MKEAKGSAAGKKQIAINAKQQTQGGGSGNHSTTKKSKEKATVHLFLSLLNKPIKLQLLLLKLERRIKRKMPSSRKLWQDYH